MTARVQTIEAQNLEFDIVIPSLIAANKKQMIRLASHEVSKMIGIGERILNDRLSEQEKETPSAMGESIAIAHLHISGLKESINVFIRLKTPVDMGAADKKAVDLFCLILTPEREGSAYLRTMARISRTLRNPQICAMLRAAQNEKTIRSILGQNTAQSLAA